MTTLYTYSKSALLRKHLSDCRQSDILSYVEWMPVSMFKSTFSEMSLTTNASRDMDHASFDLAPHSPNRYITLNFFQILLKKIPRLIMWSRKSRGKEDDAGYCHRGREGGGESQGD